MTTAGSPWHPASSLGMALFQQRAGINPGSQHTSASGLNHFNEVSSETKKSEGRNDFVAAFAFTLDPTYFFFGAGGTFLPALRASERPIAIACFGFVTFLPLRPLFSVPRFISRISVPTCLPAAGGWHQVALRKLPIPSR